MIILKWWYSFQSMNASSLTIIEFKYFCLTKRLNTKKKSCQRRTSTKNNFFLQKSYLKPYILQALLSDKKAALCQPRYCTFYAACLLTKKSCISKSYFFLSLTTREYWSIFTVKCFKRFLFLQFSAYLKVSSW